MLGQFTYREILQQPSSWKDLLERGTKDFPFFESGRFDELLFIGCGSSFHLAQAGAALFAPAVRTRALAASEVFLFPERVGRQGDRIGIVAFSRTGETTEVLRAVETLTALRAARKLQLEILGLTCAPLSGLTKVCDRTILLPIQEASLVTTQALSSTVLLMTLWAAEWGVAVDPQPVAKLADEAMRQAIEVTQQVLVQDRRHFVFLGSGTLFPMAQEGALKIMEMAGEAAVSAFRSLEYRHGPKAAVTQETLVTLLVSEEGASYEAPLHDELKALGAKTLVLMGHETDAFPSADYRVKLGTTSNAQRAILYAPTLQLLAFQQAMRRGWNPDAPAHLSRSVRI